MKTITLQVSFDNNHWPNLNNKCYDCGSTIIGHHTKLCDMAEDAIKDLPQKPGTQHWTGKCPEGLSPSKSDIDYDLVEY